MKLHRKPTYLGGRRRSFRRKRHTSNVGSFLFIAILLGVNYFVFLKDDALLPPDPAAAVGQSSADAAAVDNSATGAAAPTNGAPSAAPGEVAPFDASRFGWPGFGRGTAGGGGSVDERDGDGGTRPADGRPGPNQEVPASDDERFLDAEGAVIAGKLGRGQTVLEALREHGVDAEPMYPIINEMQKVFDFRKARVGDEYALRVDETGRIAQFDYRTSPLDRYSVTRTGVKTVSRGEAAGEELVAEYRALKRAVRVDIEMADIACAVKSSLYASVKRCGEDPALAAKLVDLLSWDVDFFQDVRTGDVFKMTVEKKYVEGRFLTYGRVVAAEYTSHGANGDGSRHGVTWFEDPERDIAGYYKPDGQAVRKEFLKTPLKFTRISSDYSLHRFHPVLHTWKKHLGVDYAAPVGSPVWAVGSGTVTHVGEKGASGNLVTIRHDNGYTSYYAHLNGFAKGLKKGDQVSQKEVIGFVGSTGRATGPHLHFALKRRGKFVNPQKIKYAAEAPIPAEVYPEFHKSVDSLFDKLNSIDVVGVDEERS